MRLLFIILILIEQINKTLLLGGQFPFVRNIDFIILLDWRFLRRRCAGLHGFDTFGRQHS